MKTLPRLAKQFILRVTKSIAHLLPVVNQLTIFLLAAVLILMIRAEPAMAQVCAERRDVSLQMALDVSPSMLEEVSPGVTRLEAARNFAISVIDGVNGTGFLDEAAAFTFCEAVPAARIFWTTPANVRANLAGSIGTCNNTSLYNAIVYGADQVRSRDVSNLRLFVAITDGADNTSSLPQSAAAAALSGGDIVSRLVFIGAGSTELQAIANAAGSSSKALAATALNLNSLVDDIVEATCVNFRPNAAMSLSDSNLRLGIEGFAITFNGSPSNDQETSDSGLTFDWTFTRPDGTTFSRSGISPEVTFNDNQLPFGEDWSVRLRVTDSRGASDTTNQNFRVIGSPPNIEIAGASVNVLQAFELEVVPSMDVDGGDLDITWDLLESPPTSSEAPQSNYHSGTGSSGAVLPSVLTTEQDIGIWRFQATATDNEGDSDQAEVTVEVLNLPPEIDLSGAEEINIGESILVDARGSFDPDGGDLTFQWDIVQAPQSGIPVQEEYSEDGFLDIPTDYSSAGTWIFRVIATDNEPEPFRESAEAEFTVLVDAPPEPAITGPDVIGSFDFPLILDGSSSLDPDSPCPDQPDRCHDTLDGQPVTISPGIVGYTWSLVDVPFEWWEEFPTGKVDEVFGIPAHAPTLNLDFGYLEPGEWTFQLEVRDGEENEDFTSFTVQVVDENGPPVAILSEPARYNVSGGGLLGEDITLSGSQSLDLDNILLGEDPRLGVTDYQWSVLEAPTGCTPPALPSGPTENTVNLYGAGAFVGPECQGFWRIGLTVTDDDAPAKTGSAETSIIIGNCPENLCIDYPTNVNPQFVEFTEDTDILIYYHLDSPLYDELAFASGMFTQLEIFHESDLATPIYTSFDPNLLSSDKGGFLVFHWNGYSDTFGRPLPGLYTLRISLLDSAFGNTLFSAVEPEAIWMQVVEPEILPTSDRYIDFNELSIRADRVTLDYEIAGTNGAIPDELRWRVFDASNSMIFEEMVPVDFSGTIEWDGLIGGVTIPAGNYTAELEAYRTGSSLGVSSRHDFTVYQVQVMTDSNNDHVIGPGDAQADFVRVARWDNGYNPAFNVRNNADPDNFIEQDPSRIYLRVRDVSANIDPTTVEQITAQLGTLNGGGAPEDNLTDVSLVENGINTGEFISRSQLLTSLDIQAVDDPNADDEFNAHDGSIGTVADDVAGDRTHRAEIDGSVQVTYQPMGAPVAKNWILPVCQRSPEARRKVQLRIHVFNEPFDDTGFDHDADPATPVQGTGNGVFDYTDDNLDGVADPTDGNGIHDAGEPSEPYRDLSHGGAGVLPGNAVGVANGRGAAFSNNQIAEELRRSDIAWAQACISTEQLGPILVDDAPRVAGVDILRDGTVNLPVDANTIYTAFSAAMSPDVVDVFFAAPIPGAGGVAFPPNNPSIAHGEDSFVLMPPTAGLPPGGGMQVQLPINFRALAHELGHIFTNQPDTPSPQFIFFPRTAPVGLAVNDSALNFHRRISQATETDARTVRPAGNLNATGNTVLRNP